MSAAIEAISAELAGLLKVVKIDVRQCAGLRAEYRIHGLPTLVLFAEGSPLARRVGAVVRRDELETWITASLEV